MVKHDCLSIRISKYGIMYCADCGTKNSSDAKFCVNCGSTLSESSQPTARPQFKEPVTFEREPEPPNILVGLDDANTSDYADNISVGYYVLAVLFWPIGFVLWAIHRGQKPESAKNLFASSLAGMTLMILVFML